MTSITDESGRLVAPPQVRPAPSLHFRIVCSWCTRVLEQGSPDAETSHSICPACLEKEFAVEAQYAIGVTVAQRILGTRG